MTDIKNSSGTEQNPKNKNPNSVAITNIIFNNIGYLEYFV